MNNYLEFIVYSDNKEFDYSALSTLLNMEPTKIKKIGVGENPNGSFNSYAIQDGDKIYNDLTFSVSYEDKIALANAQLNYISESLGYGNDAIELFEDFDKTGMLKAVSPVFNIMEKTITMVNSNSLYEVGRTTVGFVGEGVGGIAGGFIGTYTGSATPVAIPTLTVAGSKIGEAGAQETYDYVMENAFGVKNENK